MAEAQFTTTIARWVAEAPKIGDPALFSAARQAIMDVVGCMIAGHRDLATQALLNAFAATSPGQCLVFGTDRRLTAPFAALINGTSAHALDFDDTFSPGLTHSSAVLAPSLFALADEFSISGNAILDAYIFGVELHARIGFLVNAAHYRKGWHASATIGAIGAAGACARLLGLDATQVLASLSIASSMAAGSKKQFGTMMKPIHAGLAAKNAVLAALMAKAGVVGDSEPLTGPWGFAELYGARADVDTNQIIQGLGDSFAVLKPGLRFKRFPCCAAAHRTLDGILQLMETNRITKDEVKTIDVYLPDVFYNNLRFARPIDQMEARFSATYCAARVLKSGKLTLRDFTADRVGELSFDKWLKKINVICETAQGEDDRSTALLPVKTDINLHNGRQLWITVCEPKGARNNPLTATEMQQKFLDCLNHGVGECNGRKIITLIEKIQSFDNFRSLSHVIASELILGKKHEDQIERGKLNYNPL